MPKLHVVPGCSAAGSLRLALEREGRSEPIAFLPDDLSCGPIDPGTPQARATWWDLHPNDGDMALALRRFWDRVMEKDQNLVVWFGRHASMEQAFYLNIAYQLGDRPYDVVDVTGYQYEWTTRDGSRSLRDTAKSMSGTHHDGLVQLLDQHQLIRQDEKASAAGHWQRLLSENAPFRVLTPTGLVSAPADYFDPVILDRVSTSPKLVAKVIGDTLGSNYDPYIQVGDHMLLIRLVSLVETGKIIADKDPWHMHDCQIWLPSSN